MNEDALRALVRDAIARIEGAAPSPHAQPSLFQPPAPRADPSQYLYNLPPSDGPCLIEPGVACNHCGYCQSHGH
jgi:hypothetical protein